MNINVLTLILVLLFSSCSSDKEIKQNISTSDDVSLYNLAMKDLKKRGLSEEFFRILQPGQVVEF